MSSSSASPAAASRIRSVSPALASSPASGSSSAYLAPSATAASRSRHSLYGSEDYLILDLGSRIWKVGFSGESSPRAVFDVGAEQDLWDFANTSNCARLVKKWLRKVYYDELMTDPKTRKVIVLENPMLPTRVKQIIARTLFENLQIPSLSFASSPLCALLSIGRITGLVIDVGNLETCCLPIYSSRPLYSYIRTSPIASRHLRKHLHGLLKRYAAYLPHTAASSASRQAGSAPAKRTLVSPIPDDVLTPALVEEVKTRACFVMPEAVSDGFRIPEQHRINADVPMSDDPDEELQAEKAYVQHQHSQLRTRYREKKGEYDEATDLMFRLPSGTMSVPEWLRHACTDTFFDSFEDVDAPSIPEVVLDTLLKLPIDLRKVFISNILLVGGGSMLPGFTLRLASSLHTLLHREKRYTSLRGLSRHISIINGGTPFSTRQPGSTTSSETIASENTQEEPEEDNVAAFSWERALLPWVGASLVGAMKAGGKEEYTREAWDAARSRGAELDVGDWSRRGW